MITQWTIYWLTRLDKILAWTGALACTWGFVATVAFLVWVVALVVAHLPASVFLADPSEAEREAFKAGSQRFCKGIRPIWWVSLFVYVTSKVFWILLPSTKEMCAIVVVPMVANSESTQKVSQEFISLAREWMQELSPKKVVPAVKTAAKTTAGAVKGAAKGLKDAVTDTAGAVKEASAAVKEINVNVSAPEEVKDVAKVAKKALDAATNTTKVVGNVVKEVTKDGQGN